MATTKTPTAKTNSMKLTKAHARKVLAVVEQGLVNGLGEPKAGKMCVEAAVCCALGLPHGDSPPCVAPAVRAFKIALNDAAWPTAQDRAEGLKRIAIAQLGSDGIDEVVFAKELARLTIQRIVPLALRKAAHVQPDESRQQALREHAKRCEVEGSQEAADAAAFAARSAARSAAVSAAGSAAVSARSAAVSARFAAVSEKARLAVLRLAAEIGVEALKIAGSPGCKWLDIVQA